MLLKLLGKILFPKLVPWQQRKQAKTMVWTAFAAVCGSAIVGGFIFLLNYTK